MPVLYASPAFQEWNRYFMGTISVLNFIVHFIYKMKVAFLKKKEKILIIGFFWFFLQ